MILLVSDILKDSMNLCGALAAGETPTSDEYTLLLRTANVMIDRWSSQRLLLRSTHPISFATTAAKAVYTIALAGSPTPDIVSNKPLKVYSGYMEDTSGTRYDLEVVDTSFFNSLEDQELNSGPPMHAAYDPGEAQQTNQRGTISFYPTPDAAYTCHLEVDAYLSEFTAIGDTVTFEPAYYEALIYNLAVRAFRFFRDATVPVPPEILGIATNSLTNLRTLNGVQVIAGMEFPGKMAKWDVYSDSTV